MMGRRKETSFPLSHSHRPLRTSAVIVSRNRSLTAYKIIRDDWGRVSGQLKLEPHPIEQPRSQGSVLRTRLPIEGLNSSFPTYGHGFFVTTIPSPEIYLSGSTEIFSLNETAFFFGDKYCCYVNLPRNLTVSSWISRIKTIGRDC